ncbi:MAG TPA: hypothetical protein PLT45_04045 [Smithella sp.]|nr:hypothetical protein [Smithella sp.]
MPLKKCFDNRDRLHYEAKKIETQKRLEYDKKNSPYGRAASDTRAVALFGQDRPPIVFRSSMKIDQKMLNWKAVGGKKPRPF